MSSNKNSTILLATGKTKVQEEIKLRTFGSASECANQRSTLLLAKTVKY